MTSQVTSQPQSLYMDPWSAPAINSSTLCSLHHGFARLRLRHRDRRNPGGRATPGTRLEPFPHELEDSPPILRNHLHPCHLPHHRKINSAEANPCEEDVDAIAKRLIVQRIDRSRQSLRTISLSPPTIHLGMSLVDGHLQWSVRHSKRNELLPVLGPRQPPGLLQPLVQWRRGQRSQQAKDRQTRRPGPNLFQSSLSGSDRVIVHAKNK